MAGNALDAERAVGDGRGVDDEHADDFRKAQGGYAEVVAAEPQHGDGDEQPEDRGHEAPGDDREPERRMDDREGPDDVLKDPHHFLLGGGEHAQGGNVGPDGHEPGVPEREHPGEAVDEVQGQREDGVHGDEIEYLDLVAVEVGLRPDEEQGQQADGGEVEQQVAHGGLHIFSSERWPKRPVGLTRSTSTSTTKANASR